MVNWNARKYSREEFLDAYHKTSSINEMLHYLDMRVSGASYTSVRLALIDEGLLDGEVSHRVKTTRLRRMLIDDGHDSCALCGIQDWMDKTLTLHVDHIDGDNSNNSMDNLRFLCPSCHSQTETFSKKKESLRESKSCRICGKNIHRKTKGDKCSHCKYMDNVTEGYSPNWDKYPFDKDEFIELWNCSNSVSDLKKKLVKKYNFSPREAIIKSIAHSLGIDIYDMFHRGRAVKAKRSSQEFIDEILIEGGNSNCHWVKAGILEHELIENKCSSCGISGEYNGSPLTLHLEHINGVRNDHRLENLTFLCPNCHSQTNTYCGGNIDSKEKCPKCNEGFARKSYRGMCHPCYREYLVTCPDCGGVKESTQKWCSDCRSIHIKKYKPKRRSHGHREYKHKKYPCIECGAQVRDCKTQRCLDCYKKHIRKGIPSKDSLCEKLLLHEGNMSAVAREFNVSSNSVKKWLKGYGLPYLKGDIKEFISSYGQSPEQKV